MKKAPEHLSTRSRTLWTAVLRGNQSPNSAGLALLCVALECLDRATAAREVIDAEGMIQQGERLAHVHPLLRIEKDSCAMFARIWAQLCLDRLG